MLTDATGGKVHRLTPAAYHIVGRFDGATTLEDIWQEAVSDSGTDAPTQDETIRLLTQLHHGDMLSGVERPMLEDMLERRDKERQQPLKKLLLNPLSMTVPLFDPDKLLGLIVRVMGVVPAFIWWTMAAILILPATFLLPVHWGALTDRGFEGFLDLENLALLAFIYPVVKAIHELGHGVTTKSRGGEVHEMGLMFIAFYPIPYVEASASLAFPSKWDRAAVAAAGVVVELSIAAIAFFVWIGAEPGLLRTVAYNTMLIAGFSTLVVNGNPLLKFDGYHVLCDIIEIPNLGKRGNEWWGEVVRKHLLGTTERDRKPLTGWERLWFFAYPPAAFVYRVVISLTIALFVATTYRALGIVLAIWSLALTLLWPVTKTLYKGVTDQRVKVAGARAALGPGLAGVILVAGLFVIPAPHRTMAEGVIWLPREAIVRATGTGEVAAVSARLGERVVPEATLFRLDAPERFVIAERGKARVTRLNAEYSAALFNDRPAAAGLRALLEDARRNQLAADQRVEDLTVKAGVGGVLDLPVAEDLVGRFLRQGDVVGYVLPEGERSIRMVVRQNSVSLVRNSLQSISVRLAHRPAEIFSGRITGETPSGSRELPTAVLALDGGGGFATVPGSEAGLRTVDRVFQFDIALTPSPDPLPPFGMRAYIRLDFEPMPLGLQAVRAVRISFLSLFDV